MWSYGTPMLVSPGVGYQESSESSKEITDSLGNGKPGDRLVNAHRWRDARAQRIYGGTTEIMKEIVGRSVAL